MRSYGAPSIDYNRFAKLFDSDPTIQGLIDNFDQNGIQIKSNAGEEQAAMPQGPKEGKPMMAAAAKRAAANFGK
jgi:hypothetical protein